MDNLSPSKQLTKNMLANHWDIKTSSLLHNSPDTMPDMFAMPRFDDGAIDMQELLRRLAEQVVNAVMDAEADQLCGGGIRAGEPNKY